MGVLDREDFWGNKGGFRQRISGVTRGVLDGGFLG